MITYYKNICYTQKFPKYVFKKYIMLKSYAFNKNIWLNNKYIKTN